MSDSKINANYPLNETNKVLASDPAILKTNPEILLKKFRRKYHWIQKSLDKVRQERGKCLKDWSGYCYISQQGWDWLIKSHEVEHDEIVIERLKIISVLTWITSKSIYEFKKGLYQQLCQLPLPGELPGSIFYKLCEYSCYIKTPNLILKGTDIENYGFFVTLVQDTDSDINYLVILLDSVVGLIDIRLPIIQNCNLSQVLDGIEFNTSAANFNFIDLKQLVTPLLNMILYTCCKNADFVSLEQVGKPAKPKISRTSSHDRILKISKTIKTWYLGSKPSEYANNVPVLEDAFKLVQQPNKFNVMINHLYWTGI